MRQKVRRVVLNSSPWGTSASEESLHKPSLGAQVRSSDVDHGENHEVDPNRRGADLDVLRAADHGEKSPVCGSIFELETFFFAHFSFCVFELEGVCL